MDREGRAFDTLEAATSTSRRHGSLNHPSPVCSLASSGREPPPPASGDASLVATLPPAARPDRYVYEIVHTLDGTYADVSIFADGEIRVIDPRPPMVRDYGFVSLEGVTYAPQLSPP